MVADPYREHEYHTSSSSFYQLSESSLTFALSCIEEEKSMPWECTFVYIMQSSRPTLVREVDLNVHHYMLAVHAPSRVHPFFVGTWTSRMLFELVGIRPTTVRHIVTVYLFGLF